MKFIIGLGNPGSQYEYTRHNAGFLALDALAAHCNAPAFHAEKKLHALVTRAEYRGEAYLLAKPQTYMNRSGAAVQKLLAYYGALPKYFGVLAKKEANLTDTLTVIHDDVDFAFGAVKAQASRSAAGHNGVASIIEYLKTKNFRRVRIGVNAPRNEQMPTDKFVLEKFSKEELRQLANLWPQVIAAALRD